VFHVEGNLTAKKSKARLDTLKSGAKKTELILPQTEPPPSPKAPLDRLVFAGVKAAGDWQAPEEVLQEILKEIRDRLAEVAASKPTRLERVKTLQFKKEALQASVADLAVKRAAVRQRYLQKKTAQFEDQSRKVEESVGREDDVDFTINLLEQEIETVQAEVEYLREAFGHLEVGEEEGQVVEFEPQTEPPIPVVEEEEEEDQEPTRGPGDEDEELVNDQEGAVDKAARGVEDGDGPVGDQAATGGSGGEPEEPVDDQEEPVDATPPGVVNEDEPAGDQAATGGPEDENENEKGEEEEEEETAAPAGGVPEEEEKGEEKEAVLGDE
jgi:hypothetical protein